MELHPVCNFFPEMQPDEYRSLVEDIAKNGQLNPIWTYKGQIIDGRHRYRACLQMGIAPRFQEWTGQGSLTAFVVSLNLHRRNLSTSQRAAIAVEVKQQLEVETREKLKASGKKGNLIAGNRRPKEAGPLPNLVKAQPEDEPARDSTAEAAKLSDVSKASVITAVAIKKADPELFEAVKAGTKTVNAAKQEIKAKANPEAVEKPKAQQAQQAQQAPKYNPADDKYNFIDLGRVRADIPSVAARILEWIEGNRLKQLVEILQERIHA
jgi:ParB-like chromosome segregation protein Spo0J